MTVRAWNALFRYYFKEDPDTLSDEAFIERQHELVYLIEQKHISNITFS